MSRHLLLLLGFSLTTLHAADPAPADLLRQGLFEEEANQNLDKAAEHYRAVIAAHERERALAASATFRLGEIARKKNDKDAAAAAFRTVTERFPEQTELARLSRENLAALGIETATPAAPPTSTDPEDIEIARLKELARNSPDLIDGAGADGWRPLHHAAAKGWTRVISYLLENKADPNGMTIRDKLTPLQLASIHGHLGVTKTLLAAKADPDLTLRLSKDVMDALPPMDGKMKNATGTWTALDLAIVYDRRETALALIRDGADIQRVGPVVSDSQGEKEGFNALMLAIYLKRDNLAQILIDAGTSLSAIGKNDPNTPLGIALRENKSMIAPLLKAGADPNLALFRQRFSPLHFARSIEIAKMLVDAGASVKAASRDGESPLHWVQYLEQSVEMAEFLISKGADPNAKDSSGLTPLDHVAKYNEAGKNTEVIETLLKHGATIADPRELLRRTSEAMLPFVGERLVYPKLHNPDAILLSATGDHPFSVVLPTPRTVNSGRVVVPPVVQRPIQGRPELVTLEKRPAEGSPPPSLAEALREAYGNSGFLQSIRILRHDGHEAFETVREWKSWETPDLPKDWPALEWGDVIEVRTGSGGNSSSIRIAELSALIPSRNVTFRLGELEFPKTIPGNDPFWLDVNSHQTVSSLIPHNIQELANLKRFVIHRKGLPGPIKLDFTEPMETRFRLLDGDTVEMSWNVPKLYQSFSNESGVNMISLAGQGGSGSTGSQNPLDILTNIPVTPPVDFSKICILRRAENWKPEMVDFKALLDQLPPEEKWERDALIALMPKLNLGDVVVLIENHGADAAKTAAEILKKAKEVNEAMSRRQLRPPPPVPH